MIQEELKNKEKDIKGITRQACSLLDTAWTKGYVAGFKDGYATRREADKEAYKRPKGEWIIDGHHIRCNRCNEYTCDTDREGDKIPNNFCPNCGADMRGGHENGKC